MVSFRIYKYCGQGLRANFALEVLPNKWADLLALANSSLVLSHPPFEAVEVNETEFILASAWVDQWITRIVVPMEADAASGLLSRDQAWLRYIFDSLRVHILSAHLGYICISKVHISHDELDFAKFNNIVLLQHMLFYNRSGLPNGKVTRNRP